MTSEQQATAVRRYIDVVLSGQVANLTTPQIEAIVAGLAGDPEHVPAIELRNGQLGEIKAVIAAVLAPPPEPAPIRTVAPRVFLETLLTDAEAEAIQDSTHPVAKKARRTLYSLTADVELDHPLTELLVGGLAQAGLIAPERVAQILANQPAEDA